MSTNVLETMIAQAYHRRHNRAAQALAAEEQERNRQIASARARMEAALAPELWRAMGIDLGELTMHNSAPTVAGEFEIAGHSLAAAAEAAPAAIILRIILVAYDVCGRVIDRDQLISANLYGDADDDHSRINTERVAEALRAAVALAPDARLKMAARVRKDIDAKITSNTYRQTDAGHIDRSRARAIREEIARARALLDDEQRASLRRELYRFAATARRNQIEDRARRARFDARAAAAAAITEAARQYAPIYAQYEQAARTWAQNATSLAWANIPDQLWTVRYGRVISEADEDGNVYRSEPEQIVTPDADEITWPLKQNLRYHTARRVEYDGSTTPIIIANVIDLTPYTYGEITTAGTMAYCHTYAAQPAGAYVNVPHGSTYRPPAPPALYETWPEFCQRTAGHIPAQNWRAYLDDADEANQADRAALTIPF